MHVLDVVGRPGHQSTHRVAGEKGDGQIQDMDKQLHAQIVHDHEAGIFHDHFLDEI